MPSERNLEIDYERSDVNPRLVAALAGGLAGIVAVALFILAVSFNRSLHEKPIPHVEPPAPRLQIHARQDMNAFRAAEDRRLQSYGWVDKAKGIVHIPIAQAMQDIAREGAPQWPASAH
jgi:hypothetical protein